MCRGSPFGSCLLDNPPVLVDLSVILVDARVDEVSDVDSDTNSSCRARLEDSSSCFALLLCLGFGTVSVETLLIRVTVLVKMFS